MDTKLKKTHSKLHIIAIIIILLTILVPSAVLVAFYPRMEEAAEKLIKEAETEAILWINSEVNLDAVGYLIALKVDSVEDEQVKNVLKDYLEAYQIEARKESIKENCLYYIEMYGKTYTNITGPLFAACSNMMTTDIYGGEYDQSFKDNGVCGYTVMTIENVDDYPYIWYNDVAFDDVGISGVGSHYIRDYYSFDNFKEVVPECKAIFLVEEDSSYVYEDYGYLSRESAYEHTGAFYLMAGIMIVAAAIAFVLPFFKFLETGDERLFRLPLLGEIAVGCLYAFGAMVMYYLMAYSPGPFMEVLKDHFTNDGNFRLIGYDINEEIVYIGILIVNFLCWIILFILQYMTFTALHQIIFHPIKHIKERLIITKLVVWFNKKWEKFKDEIIQVELRKGMKKNITVILVANFIIVTILCSLWFFGIIGLIVYSVLLGVAAVNIAKRIQDKYDKALNAAEQMGEGNLRIKLDDDLGMFSDLGEKLEKIQEGFRNAVVEEAKSQNMKTELITNVSHDLKTPLTAIITYVNLLKDENISEEERRQYIETLDMKSQRLKSLIEDLFEISKANSGNVQMNYMDVDIVGLVKQVRLEMEDKIADSTLSFRWNLPEEKIILSLDSQRTYRIYENLLVNVLKYSLDGSRVYIDVEESEDEVKVIMKNVSKTEMDFDPEQLTERFVRGDASRNSEGSGLGLAIVKSFVELQEGKFYIDIDGDLFKAVTVWPKNK